MSDAPTHHASGAVVSFADATGRFLPLVCTLNATKVADAMAHMLGRSRDEFEQLALSGPSGASGVVLLPYFDGERTPNLPDATGTLGGAGVATSGGRVTVVGGGARSEVLPQLLADLLQRPVDVATTAEYVARARASRPPLSSPATTLRPSRASGRRAMAAPSNPTQPSTPRSCAASTDISSNALIPNQETEREPHLVQ